ncbi:MAG: ABC transporter ATP-binding protein [Actinomycetota bacterium]|nr:ABC transporter ATP-binding protein [Geodermatophilaceae bacterium]MDQ3505143.1 ABC transporter ATP-binding protein [Actinomycetota bacterium]
MLIVDDLVVRYGAVEALKGVSLEVPDNSVVAVLGSNGAGKSTLLRAISGTHRLHRGRIEQGSISYRAADRGDRSETTGLTRIDKLDPARTVGHGIVQSPEGRRIFGRLTVDENLRAGGMNSSASRTARSETRDRVLSLFPILGQRRGQRASLLSGGEQQMLAMGRALMASPTLLLLDEPSLGLAPQIVEQIGEIVLEINRMGTSVLLVEQNASMALRVAQYAHVLEVGKVSLSGPAEELANTDQVRELYLGHGAERISGTAAVGRSQHLTRWTG